MRRGAARELGLFYIHKLSGLALNQARIGGSEIDIRAMKAAESLGCNLAEFMVAYCNQELAPIDRVTEECVDELLRLRKEGNGRANDRTGSVPTADRGGET